MVLALIEDELGDVPEDLQVELADFINLNIDLEINEIRHMVRIIARIKISELKK